MLSFGSRFRVQGSRGGFAAEKGSQPRLAALGSPFQGKGLAWTLPPSYGRRCPEGAEVGWGKRYEKERERSSQVRRLRKHPSAADAVPFPQWGRQRGGGFAVPKGSQPRLAALGSPFQGKGLAWTLPPSYGRRCPEGAEVGWGSGMKKIGGRSSQVRRLREHPGAADAVPLLQWGRLRYESIAIPISSERIHGCVEKQYPRHSLPLEGKVASGASRIGY